MNIKEFLSKVNGSYENLTNFEIITDKKPFLEFLKTKEWDDYFNNTFINEKVEDQEKVVMFLMDVCYNLSDNTPDNKMVEAILASPQITNARKKIFTDSENREKEDRIRTEKAKKKRDRRNKLRLLDSNGRAFVEVAARYPLTINLDREIVDEIDKRKNLRDMPKLLLNSRKEYLDFNDDKLNRKTIILHLFLPTSDDKLLVGCEVLTSNGATVADGLYETISYYEVLEDNKPVKIQTPHSKCELIVKGGKVVKQGNLKTVDDYDLGITYINE